MDILRRIKHPRWKGALMGSGGDMMKPREELKDRTRQKLLKLSFREKANGKTEPASAEL